MNRRLVVRIVTALLAVAMFAVPTSALAGKGGGGKNKNKALVVCKHGCKYRTIQKAVNKAKKQEDQRRIKVKPGKYVEGVQVFGKKYNGLTIKGTKSRTPEDDPRGQERPAPRRHRRRQQRHRDRRRQERHDQEHVGPELRHQRRLLPRLRHRRQQEHLQELHGRQRRRVVQPQLRALRLRLRRRHASRTPSGWGHGDSRLLRRRHAVPGQPEDDDAEEPRRPTRTCSATPARTRSTS